ncbi:tryptophan 2,3-dioxygenase family protein [Actinoplanes friuliensis]|uniref:Tryptophan 2,3-dioxygenase (Vermilion) n=1 Tax=Actinoplanes friuliensis DSM 7358 TaxID=1246995 RepID=U5WAN3_9ACTN|nr:tryptophan 2,3-dioxygenase family protein [Actinoplanes friuliensis]AGZ46047.1 tryptophan 2,3-dioxygenase (vermilion) [Actinoplanes friuliensis DSM 7358]
MRKLQRDETYRDLLRLDELLDSTLVRDGGPDRMLFLVTHQICEMWFALILGHLDEARSAILAGDPGTATARIGRLPAIMQVLSAQFDVLATLTPAAFERIRADLGSASGIQSSQWREIEFACGLRETRYLTVPGFTEQETARLVRRMDEISVADAYAQLAKQRRDAPDPGAMVAVEQLRAAMLDFDEAVVAWRARHASLAERFLGGRPGTAGSEGSSYLWRMTARRLFPDAWPGANGGTDA